MINPIDLIVPLLSLVILGLASLFLVLDLLLFVISPAFRRRRTAKFEVILLAVLASLSGFGAAPVLRAVWEEHERQLAIDAATLHLAAPRNIGGVEFPAGSTVYVGRDGTAWSGNVPMATIIKGVSLIGEFQLGTDYNYNPVGGIALSTLAIATDVNGVPCAPGPFILRQDGLRCTLGRDYEYMGHLLMHGQVFDVDRSINTHRITLGLGTLAQPEQLDDVTWPAGTIIGGITASPGELRHGVAEDGNPVQLCLKPGVDIVVKGAMLHGPILYGFSKVARWIDLRCSPLTTFREVAPKYSDGFAQIGNNRFQEGGWSSDKGWQHSR